MTTSDDALAELRQGDICELDLFPHWTLSTAAMVSQGLTPTHLQIPAMPKVLTAKFNQTRRLAVVCSYDCDLENPRDRQGVLVAPLFALSERHRQYEAISQSGQLKVAANGDRYFEYLQYFPIEVGNLTAVDTTLGVADFSAMTSFGKATEAVDFLRQRKVSEFSEEQRDAFRVKLATFVGRPELASVAAANETAA